MLSTFEQNEHIKAFKLLSFKIHEIEFIEEYVIILAPIDSAIDRLHGKINIFLGKLHTTLLTVQNKLDEFKLDNLNTVASVY